MLKGRNNDLKMVADGRGASQPAPLSAPRLSIWGATGDAHGASQPVAQPTMLESEHMTDEATYFRAGMKIITYA